MRFKAWHKTREAKQNNKTQQGDERGMGATYGGAKAAPQEWTPRLYAYPSLDTPAPQVLEEGGSQEL